jgi:ribosomal protein S1
MNGTVVAPARQEVSKMYASAHRRQLTKTKWDRIKSRYHIGKIVHGEMLTAIDGGFLIHILSGKGAIGYLKSVEVQEAKKYLPDLKVDADTLEFTVEGYDNGRKHLELSLQRIYSDPSRVRFLQAQAGDEVEGTVQALLGSGCFLDLTNGLAGFLPLTEIPFTGSPDDMKVEELVHEGDLIRARVLRKIESKLRLEVSVRALWTQASGRDDNAHDVEAAEAPRSVTPQPRR